jgi:hypothetical protein
MANYLPNGSSHINCPTLGNLIASGSTYRIVFNDLLIPYSILSTTTQFFFMQGSDSTNEFNAYFTNNSLRINVGGTNTIIAGSGTLFGTSNDVDGYFAIEVDFATNNADIYYIDDTTPVYSTALSTGTSRVDGAHLFIGGRPSSDVITDTSTTLNLAAGVSVGDIDILVDGVLSRSYEIPTAGLTVPDTTSSQDATLYGDDESAWSLIIDIENVEYLPPTGWDYVTYDDSLIPESSVMYYAGGTHDGSDGVATLSDSTASFTTNEFVGLQVNNLSKITDEIVASNTATTIPTSLTWDAGDYYSVTIEAKTNMQIAFETTTSLGGAVNMNPNGVFSITGVSGNHTFDVKYLDPADGSRSSISTISAAVS